MFGSLFGAGVFVTACVAGAVSFTQPFHLMERPFLRWQQQQSTHHIIPLSVPRDVSFYLCAGFWAFYIFWRQEIRVGDAVGFLALYVVYIAVVVVGRYINNKHRADTHQTQSILSNDELSEEQEEEEAGAGQLSRHPTLTGNPPEIQLVRSTVKLS